MGISTEPLKMTQGNSRKGPEVPYDIRIDLVDVDEGNPHYRDDAGGLVDAETP